MSGGHVQRSSTLHQPPYASSKYPDVRPPEHRRLLIRVSIVQVHGCRPGDACTLPLQRHCNPEIVSKLPRLVARFFVFHLSLLPHDIFILVLFFTHRVANNRAHPLYSFYIVFLVATQYIHSSLIFAYRVRLQPKLANSPPHPSAQKKVQRPDCEPIICMKVYK